jgi:glutamine synthetase
VRYLEHIEEAELGFLREELAPVIEEFHGAILKLEDANLEENQPHGDVLEHAVYMRDTVVPAMESAREIADRLEKLVADDLWPLPKYSEMLFIK